MDKTKEVMAAVGTATSGASTVYSWLAAANDILQLVATLAAIAAGAASAYYYFKKARESDRR